MIVTHSTSTWGVWALFLAAWIGPCVSFAIGRSIGREEMRAALLKHPALRSARRSLQKIPASRLVKPLDAA